MRTVDLIQAINDAAALQAVLMPILQDAVANKADEVSDDAVAAAKAKLQSDQARLDAKIEAMPG